jgi:hypothetical protein
VSDDEDDDGKDDRNLYIVLIRYINTHVIRSCPTPPQGYITHCLTRHDFCSLYLRFFCLCINTLFKIRIGSLQHSRARPWGEHGARP